jgi:hypothetical protein
MDYRIKKNTCSARLLIASYEGITYVNIPKKDYKPKKTITLTQSNAN